MVMTIVLVAFQIFLGTVAGTARQRVIQHENSAALESARVMLEVLRDEPFEQIYALYNADPTDDPDGPGTAPGASFAVPRLDPYARAGTLAHGEIVFPSWSKEDKKGEDPPKQELRETHEDRALGMPRDLNGDGKIDDKNHADDYIVLPVLVRVTWEGKTGPRETRLHSMFTDFAW